MKKCFEVTVLGSSSATPTILRHNSSQFVRINRHCILLDCGEGSQMQLLKYGLRAQSISHVLITHLHGDHCFGLPGLIASMSLSGRRNSLVIVGPPKLESMIFEMLALSDCCLTFDLKFVKTQLEHQEIVISNDDFDVVSIPLKHRIHCNGYIVREKGPMLKLNLPACLKYKVPVNQYKSLTDGEDFLSNSLGLISNQLLTSKIDIYRTYAYITDTIYDPEYLVPIVKGVDLLYHEATFLHDRSDRAAQTYHSTSLQAAEIARSAGVKRLLIGHFSARYFDTEPLVREAESVFDCVSGAVEGAVYSL